MADIPNVNLESRSDTVMQSPDRMVKVREAFGVDSDMEVPAFSEADERVPDLDPAYVFDPDTTLAICAWLSCAIRCSGRRWARAGSFSGGDSWPARPRHPWPSHAAAPIWAASWPRHDANSASSPCRCRLTNSTSRLRVATIISYSQASVSGGKSRL